jgi:serine/threonine protein kinase
MAPEQIEGKPSKSSDQYALGVVVYEWLCGSFPFTGPDEEIATQHLQVPPPPLCERAPSVPSAIEQVVMQALAKDPSQRFLSVLHFAQVLEEAYQPHKLVRLLRSSSNGHSVDVKDTPSKHDTHRITEPEPFSSPSSPSVLNGNDDDKIMSSPQNMPMPQAAPEPSAQAPRRVSRRMILAGLAGLAAVSTVSAGAIWSFRDLRFSASSSRGSSRIIAQPTSASQATPGTTISPTSGASKPVTTSGNPHATPTQHGGSTPSTTSAPTAMPTPQATPTANTTSTSAYTYTAKTTPTAMPTATPTPTPTPQPQPTRSGSSQQGTQGQQDDQGQDDQGQNGQ